jgi:hypothetical protein
MGVQVKSVAATAAAVALLAGGSATAFAASPQVARGQRAPATVRMNSPAADSQEIGFSFTIKNLPAGKVVQVAYGAGFMRSTDTKVTETSGDFGTAQFSAGGFALLAGHSTLSAVIIDGVIVTSAPFTGTATIPAGASVTVTNTTTQQVVTLSSGVAFSIPTGFSGVGAPPPPPPPVTTTVTCHGTALFCLARIPIAGGASGGTITVRLPAAYLRLKAQIAPRGAKWTLTGGHYEQAGHQFVATLSANAANPAGSQLTLVFTRN